MIPENASEQAETAESVQVQSGEGAPATAPRANPPDSPPVSAEDVVDDGVVSDIIMTEEYEQPNPLLNPMNTAKTSLKSAKSEHEVNTAQLAETDPMEAQTRQEDGQGLDTQTDQAREKQEAAERKAKDCSEEVESVKEIVDHRFKEVSDEYKRLEEDLEQASSKILAIELQTTGPGSGSTILQKYFAKIKKLGREKRKIYKRIDQMFCDVSFYGDLVDERDECLEDIENVIRFGDTIQAVFCRGKKYCDMPTILDPIRSEFDNLLGNLDKEAAEFGMTLQ